MEAHNLSSPTDSKVVVQGVKYAGIKHISLTINASALENTMVFADFYK